MVQPFHSTERNSTGKLAEAAIAKASDTMKAMFCFSNTMPRITATTPSASVVMRETFSSEALSALPFLNTVAYRSCDHLSLLYCLLRLPCSLGKATAL